VSATGTGPRGNYARGLATREEIVAAAGELLVERGFHGASITAIAERCDLTRAGVLHHFLDKEHILLAVLEDRMERDKKWIRARNEHQTNLIDRTIDLMERLVTGPEGPALLLGLSGASIDSEHPAHAWFVGRYEFQRSVIPELVRQGQRAGDIRDDRPAEDISIELVAMMEGLLLHWLHARDAVDPVRLMRAFCDTLRPPQSLAGG
jgi:AcrR family transcriptional regulator